jgi:hypothetical protein
VVWGWGVQVQQRPDGLVRKDHLLFEKRPAHTAGPARAGLARSGALGVAMEPPSSSKLGDKECSSKLGDKEFQ